MPERPMRIGDIAQKSGFSIDTLRYYDRIGLLRPTRRDAVSRYREYEAGALEQLKLVEMGKHAGLGLAEIRKVLRAAQQGAACDTVSPLLKGKISEIDRAIHVLRELRTRLVAALKQSRKRKTDQSCPILQGLSKRHVSSKDSEKEVLDAQKAMAVGRVARASARRGGRAHRARDRQTE